MKSIAILTGGGLRLGNGRGAGNDSLFGLRFRPECNHGDGNSYYANNHPHPPR